MVVDVFFHSRSVTLCISFSLDFSGGGLNFSSELSDDHQDVEYIPPVRFQREQQRHPDEISIPSVNRKSLLQSTTPAATRFGLSSAAHLAMVASTVNAAGGDMNQIVASLPTAKRHRKSAQQQIAISVRDQFIEKYKGMYKTLHWDGKVTQFLDAQGLVYQDCNAVVLSIPMSARTPQFIGAPVVQRGTGVLLADACMHCLDDWEATEDIIGIGSDTTSANTGIHEGAAVHIEEQLGKPVLWLACRHHMAELHVKHPYDKVQGPTKGMISCTNHVNHFWTGLYFIPETSLDWSHNSMHSVGIISLTNGVTTHSLNRAWWSTVQTVQGMIHRDGPASKTEWCRVSRSWVVRQMGLEWWVTNRTLP